MAFQYSFYEGGLPAWAVASDWRGRFELKHHCEICVILDETN